MKRFSIRQLKTLCGMVLLLLAVVSCDDTPSSSYRGIMLISNGAYGSPASDVAYLNDNLIMVMSTKNAGTITGMQYKSEYMADWAAATPDGENFNCTIIPANYNNQTGWVSVEFRAQNSDGEEFSLQKNGVVYATADMIEGAGKWLDRALQSLKDARPSGSKSIDFTIGGIYDGVTYHAVVVTGNNEETDTIFVRSKGKQNPTGLHEHTHIVNPVTTELELRGALQQEWFGDGVSADTVLTP